VLSTQHPLQDHPCEFGPQSASAVGIFSRGKVSGFEALGASDHPKDTRSLLVRKASAAPDRPESASRLAIVRSGAAAPPITASISFEDRRVVAVKIKFPLYEPDDNAALVRSLRTQRRTFGRQAS
jgi:hypothetical protein